MSDRFRELESPLLARTKDVVLMATVSSFEGLGHRGRNEIRQFAELFEPIFKASSQEARRNAAAALARCDALPRSVAWFLASQPIDIAALFLPASPVLDDEMLIAVARLKGREHARAITARANLSVAVVDALVALHQGLPERPRMMETVEEIELTAIDQPPDPRASREESLRQTLKALVARDTLVRDEESAEAIDARDEALLIRFARLREAHAFSRMLAYCLGSSLWLTNRVMLDVSGLQLATALKALGMHDAENSFVLRQFYPHLAAVKDSVLDADALIASLDGEECADRLAIWIRADDYTQGRLDDHAANANDGGAAALGLRARAGRVA